MYNNTLSAPTNGVQKRADDCLKVFTVSKCTRLFHFLKMDLQKLIHGSWDKISLL